MNAVPFICWARCRRHTASVIGRRNINNRSILHKCGIVKRTRVRAHDALFASAGLADIKTYADGIGPWRPQMMALTISPFKSANADGTPMGDSPTLPIPAAPHGPRF